MQKKLLKKKVNFCVEQRKKIHGATERTTGKFLDAKTKTSSTNPR